MAMRKALHIIDHIGVGGAQRIIEGILKKRPQDKLLYLNFKKISSIEIKNEQFLFSGQTTILKQLSAVIKLSSRIKANEIQIIHCHLKFSWLLGLAIKSLARNLKGVKILFHEHDPEIIHKKYYPYLLKFSVTLGDVVTVSRFLHAELTNHDVPKEKIYLLRNFVDTERFYPLGNKKPSLIGRNRLVIGFTGRLVARKGWKDVIEMGVLLREEGVVIRVVGIGEDKRKFLKAVIEHGLEDMITFLGPSDNVCEFFHSLDLLVMPSLFESSGLVHIEAQACGVPVIAYDIPGVNEVISSENAILVPRGDVEMIVHEIKQLSSDSTRYQTLVTKGLENAKAHSLDIYIPRLEQLYDELFGLED
jgi:glycosyltransferase involved in cell wall biosynthesis